jgi:hypothetical protein
MKFDTTSALMRAHQVTTRVNNPGYQGDDLLEDVALKTGSQ